MNCIICNKEIKLPKRKYCSTKCQNKSWKLFNRKKYLECKKKYREKNRDKILAYNRKIRKQGLSPLKSKQKAEIYKRKGKICNRCGKTNDLCIHHIKPLRKRGNNLFSNLMVLCNKCHVEWHKKMDDYWF